jgi:hypothetical protein
MNLGGSSGFAVIDESTVWRERNVLAEFVRPQGLSLSLYLKTLEWAATVAALVGCCAKDLEGTKLNAEPAAKERQKRRGQSAVAVEGRLNSVS